tara:strand:+ start:129 stop:908 length:780 start_codon:yes stop_codon:yes gene_type:complete
MEKNYLVSIVTVSYNDYDNLLLTHKSIFKQTFKNFEWIVIDGNSSDATVEFLKTVDAENFEYISEADKGLYDAMNKGIARATGKYIIFLNAGDVFSSDNILQICADKFSEDKSIDLLYGDSYEINEEEETFLRKSREMNWIKFGMFTHHQAMFYKREIIEKYQFKYNQEYNIAADYDFTAKFINHSSNVVYLQEAICTFRQGGLSHQSWYKGIQQQWDIRKDNFNMNVFQLSVLHCLQSALHIVRFNFTFLYNVYRFKK